MNKIVARMTVTVSSEWIATMKDVHPNWEEQLDRICSEQNIEQKATTAGQEEVVQLSGRYEDIETVRGILLKDLEERRNIDLREVGQTDKNKNSTSVGDGEEMAIEGAKFSAPVDPAVVDALAAGSAKDGKRVRKLKKDKTATEKAEEEVDVNTNNYGSELSSDLNHFAEQNPVAGFVGEAGLPLSSFAAKNETSSLLHGDGEQMDLIDLKQTMDSTTDSGAMNEQSEKIREQEIPTSEIDSNGRGREGHPSQERPDEGLPNQGRPDKGRPDESQQYEGHSNEERPEDVVGRSKEERPERNGSNKSLVRILKAGYPCPTPDYDDNDVSRAVTNLGSSHNDQISYPAQNPVVHEAISRSSYHDQKPESKESSPVSSYPKQNPGFQGGISGSMYLDQYPEVQGPSPPGSYPDQNAGVQRHTAESNYPDTNTGDQGHFKSSDHTDQYTGVRGHSSASNYPDQSQGFQGAVAPFGYPHQNLRYQGQVTEGSYPDSNHMVQGNNSSGSGQSGDQWTPQQIAPNSYNHPYPYWFNAYPNNNLKPFVIINDAPDWLHFKSVRPHNQLEVYIHIGDITKQQTPVIVTSTNSIFSTHGSTSHAVFRAAGPSLHQECQHLIAMFKQFHPGNVVPTAAGNLFPVVGTIFHAILPDAWQLQNHPQWSADCLFACFLHCFQLAVQQSRSAMSLPAIGSKLFGVPKVVEAFVSSLHIFDQECSHPSVPQFHRVEIHFVTTDAQKLHTIMGLVKGYIS